MIFFANTINKAHIIYWFCIKCKQLTCSVLITELYVMAYEFDKENDIRENTTSYNQNSINIGTVEWVESKGIK